VNLTEESQAHLLLIDRVLISFIENPPGCVFPIHDHESEQLLIILEGEQKHVCGDETFLIKAGDVCVEGDVGAKGAKKKTIFLFVKTILQVFGVLNNLC
jgi:quercetin dioxygenase-like cupin family protein